MRADMHLHTFYSDGAVSPERVFEKAAQRGLDLVCITDHDCICSADRLERAKGQLPVIYVPSIEVSAYWQDVKIHMLCYNPDLENPDWKSFLKELKDGSYRRAEVVLNKLKNLGINLTMAEVEAEKLVEGIPIHSMHISRAGAKKGFAESEFKFYTNYLMWGAPAFSTEARPSPERTAEIAFASGAVVSLAHPGRIDLDKNTLKKGIVRLQSCGLKGIEGVYTTHTDIETAYFKEIAKELNLFITGGSDTHFENDGRHEMGLPEFHPSKELLQALKIC